MSDTLEKQREEVQEKEEKMPKNPSQNRIHVSYPDSMKNKIEEIRTETDKSSLSEVFRQAIMFYALAYEEHKKGSDFLIRNKSGEVERLRMFL